VVSSGLLNIFVVSSCLDGERVVDTDIFFSVVTVLQQFLGKKE